MIPTSLYIHIPWCIRKCPYCDFNSHQSPTRLPEEDYIAALIADFTQDLGQFPRKNLGSIFIGGGTPSLFSAHAFAKLLTALQQQIAFAEDIEITLEANPGTVEQQRFQEYRALGINRLSLGIQSFNAAHLQTLGRIHDAEQAHKAIESARSAGFDNINLDIMHSLPHQTVAQGLEDLHIALSYQPEHLSWYQLTLEPNTVFYKTRPSLPTEDTIDRLEEEGHSLLEAQGYKRYEISAYCQTDKMARHNLNYWLFGDYYGIGAGAHGKFTTADKKIVYRTRKNRQPQDYLSPVKPFLVTIEQVNQQDLIFEFMLNATRLQQPIRLALFNERTGLPVQALLPKLAQAQAQGLICLEKDYWQVTVLGRRFTNNLQELFLPDTP